MKKHLRRTPEKSGNVLFVWKGFKNVESENDFDGRRQLLMLGSSGQIHSAVLLFI